MNPFRRLRHLPWAPLSLTALFTALITVGLEFLLMLGYDRVGIIRETLDLLLAPPLGLIVELALAIGVGALAVYCLERLYARQVFIDRGSLWALVLCLIGAILLKTLLSPINLITLNEVILIGMIVGVFVKGRRYWR